jgi:hypothetical protein
VDYLTHYEPNVVTVNGLEGHLLLQLSDFLGRIGPFASIDAKWQLIRSTRTGQRVNPRSVWRLFTSNALAHVAIALLSIPSSEASVERTFSLQAAVHSKQRNRLLDSTVESEMFFRFTQNVLAKQATINDSCIEMDDDFDSAVHGEAFSLWEEAEAAVSSASAPAQIVVDDNEEQLLDPEEPEQPAAELVVAADRPRRTESSVFQQNNALIDWWIEENRVRASFQFTREIRNRLENDAWERNRGGPSTKELEKQIRAEAQRRAL